MASSEEQILRRIGKYASSEKYIENFDKIVHEKQNIEDMVLLLKNEIEYTKEGIIEFNVNSIKKDGVWGNGINGWNVLNVIIKIIILKHMMLYHSLVLLTIAPIAEQR